VGRPGPGEAPPRPYGAHNSRDDSILQGATPMLGKEFLNPTLKIILCLAGMVVMGYYLNDAIQTETFSDKLTIVRALVFLGFSFLLVRSVKDMIGPSNG
jgi:hypothetical protein